MRKKIIINIEKGYILSILLGVLGLVLLVAGLVKNYNIRTAIQLEECTLDEFTEGKYVCGVISRYAGKMVENAGDGTFLGESSSWIAGVKEYVEYTIRLPDEKYITVLIDSKEKREKLQTYDMGSGDIVRLEGKVVKIPTELNYQWLSDALGVESETEVEQLVSPHYAIQEISFEDEKKFCSYGIGLLVTAMIIFVAKGGIHNFIFYEKG